MRSKASTPPCSPTSFSPAASTIAALGVAAHEAGHAIQDSAGYWPMKFRQTLVPAAQFGEGIWIFPVIAGFLLSATGLVTIGLILFAAVVLFQLVRSR